MSDLTTFFPAATGGGGSGGGLVSDPRDLPATLVYPYYLQTKYADGAFRRADQTQWWNLFIGNGSGAPGTSGTGGIKSAYNTDFASISVNTYGTIADVTSTTGGIMRFCMAPLMNPANGNSYTFKITLDGTVYEIPGTVNNNFDTPSYNFVAFLGSVNWGQVNITSGTLAGGQVTFNNYHGMLDGTPNGTTNGPIDSGQYFSNSQYSNYYWLPVNLASMGGLKYKESLKVEFKCSAYSSNVNAFSSRGLSVIANFDDIN